MRIVFVSLPVKAHLNAVIPLAWALRGAGHDVVLTGDWGPERDATGHITASGLTAVPLGREGDVSPVRPGAHNESGFLALDPEQAAEGEWERFRAALRYLYTEVYAPGTEVGEQCGLLRKLVSFTRSWQPDLVLWDMLAFPAPVAARLCGAAHARIVWGTDTVGMLRTRTPGDSYADWLRPMLAPYGLPYGEDLLLGQWSVDLGRPHPYELPGRSVPVRRIPFSGSAVLAPWLCERPRRPRVVLTLGVTRQEIHRRESAFPLRDFLDAAGGLDAEVLVTLTDSPVPLPPNVRAVGYVPFDQLLPTCSAIVHQGGRGTFASAAAFRVPQIVVPQPLWDESATARQVAAYRAGLSLDLAGLDGTSLCKALVRVLTEPAFREGAQRLHTDLMADPAPTDCVTRLEELTALHRGRRA
ncbi:nucleotide disphospho-sugar-binding domain-containing protein [Kitasatospora brasiliensis]|uniref:nucleotide disphospho-sugar-binding domain-containing protein n=1 Tax=Kitasatospora brasiliensis TaxID=3058040 RepID=UPI00292F05D3|nr:nucleotide disphospho-sugar-binding domain-containing protein [Kitasatospora sp. K002]